MDRWVRLGIEAYRSGNRAQAQRYLRYALMEKPEDITAWLWLVEVADNDAEKRHCLEQVLKIDPGHQIARQAMALLQTKDSAAPAPHVDPFDMDEEELSRAAPALASVEVRTTPPFILELENESITNKAEPLPEKPPPFWRHQTTWVTAGLIAAGLVAIAVIVFLIVRMAGAG